MTMLQATAITIDSSENVGIGNNCGMTILCNSPGDGAIYFGDSADNDIGGIAYSHFDNKMFFKVNGAERYAYRLVLESSGGKNILQHQLQECSIGSWTIERATQDGDAPIQIQLLLLEHSII
jgi:hypothetical protein